MASRELDLATALENRLEVHNLTRELRAHVARACLDCGALALVYLEQTLRVRGTQRILDRCARIDRGLHELRAEFRCPLLRADVLVVDRYVTQSHSWAQLPHTIWLFEYSAPAPALTPTGGELVDLELAHPLPLAKYGARFAPIPPCGQCGRRGYHLASCSEGKHV